jgi:threonine dehydrogenase-like Zn-dependent dehydrogenase
MKAQAIFITGRGRTEIRDIEAPDPRADEVQARTLANGICMGEVSAFRGTEAAPLGPAGHEGIGVVTKVGRDVKRVREGDCVATFQWSTVVNLSASSVSVFSKPPADPAAFIAEPASCAVTAWYSYGIIPGDRVLVLGAGYMGLLNIQLLGQSPLSALAAADVRADNLTLAGEYGATELINSATPQGKARLDELKQKPFDLVVECAGAAETVKRAGELTRAGGRLAIFAWHHEPRTVDMGIWHMRGLRVLNSAPMIGADWAIHPFQRAIDLLERGVFDQRKLITHRHPFGDAQKALEEASVRAPGYRKGVLLFP